MSTNIGVDVEAIDSLRARVVWTWSELASKAGISPATRSKLRRGEPMSVRTIRRVAKALNVAPESIVKVEHEAAQLAAVVAGAA